MSRPKVFVALDHPDRESALKLFRELRPVNPCFKVGLELFTAEGPAIVRELADAGAEVFLDLKFHDIPNTVAGAVRSSVSLGAAYINLHCASGSEAMRAGVAAAKEEADKKSIPAPKVLGVTILTSLDDQAVQEIGFPRSASAQVKHFVELAQSAGLDGVVCSGRELPLVRQLVGPGFLTMVPGIRPAGSGAGDQKRTLTPAEAKAAGADCLVVGRPVTGAVNPVAALREILAAL